VLTFRILRQISMLVFEVLPPVGLAFWILRRRIRMLVFQVLPPVSPCLPHSSPD